MGKLKVKLSGDVKLQGLQSPSLRRSIAIILAVCLVSSLIPHKAVAGPDPATVASIAAACAGGLWDDRLMSVCMTAGIWAAANFINRIRSGDSTADIMYRDVMREAENWDERLW